jgi:hypothetical protein
MYAIPTKHLPKELVKSNKGPWYGGKSWYKLWALYSDTIPNITLRFRIKDHIREQIVSGYDPIRN